MDTDEKKNIESVNKQKKKININWFRNFKTYSKYGKKTGLYSKDRDNVEYLVLNDYELK